MAVMRYDTAKEDMDQEFSISEARRHNLPDTDPINGEAIVWAPIPAIKVPTRNFDFAAATVAGAILGDGCEAVA